jgi:hypothetical membrane protein
MQPEIIIALIGFLLLAPAMCTLGAVLLLRFWVAGFGRPARIIAAAVCGPVMLLAFIVVAGFSETRLEGAELLGAIAVLLIPILLVGLPVSLFATRKLDRLLEVRASVFE